MSPLNRKSVIRVLHVDDDPSLQEITKLMLLDLDRSFEIDHACCVDEAFKKLATGCYDVVVSDYEMPQKDGLQFLAELRNLKNEIPFILFTGKGRQDVAIKALNLGAEGYYHKQGSPETVYGELAHGIQLVAERAKVKSALCVCENRYHTLMDQAAEAIFVHDANGQIVNVNVQACKDLGYTKKELLSLNMADITPDATKNGQGGVFWSKVLSGQSVTFENTHIRKDKSTFPVEVTLGPMTLGQETLVICLARDITDRSDEWRKTFDAISDFIFVLDKDHRFIRANQAICDFLKKQPEELMGKRCFEVLHGTAEVLLGCPCEKAKSTRKLETIEKGDPHSGVWFLLSVWPLFDEKGEYTGCIHTAKDITDSKKTEDALMKSQEEYSSIFANMIDGFAYCQMVFSESEKPVDFVYLHINDAFEKITGLKREIVVGKKVTDAIPGIREANPELFEIYGRVALTGQSERFEVFLKPLSMWLYVSVYCPRKGFFAAIFEDISERKKAEEKLKRLKAFDEKLINSLGSALLVIDPDNYRIIAVNDATIEQSKLKKEDILGKTCYEITHHKSNPCQPPNDICPMQEVLKTDKPVTVEHVHLDENNNKRIVEVSASSVKNPEGKTVIIHVAKDITERKQIETHIQQAERRYHALFDQTPLGVLIINPQTGVPIEFNDEAHNQLGYSREEFANLCIYDYKANETSLETRDRIDKILGGGIFEWETKHRAKNGEVRDVVITSKKIELAGKTFLHSIYRDVTEAKAVEAALMESETKYRMLVELAQEGVWALDNDNCTVFVNSRLAQMLGYNESDMVGKNLTLFVGDPDLAINNLQGCKLGHQGQCEFELIRKDGKLINVNVAASSFQDDIGVCIGTLALVSDITERKKNEEALRNSEQRWATTLRSIGDGVIATDLLGQITFMNRVAEDLTGWSLQEASKKRFRDVFKIVNDQTYLEVEDPVASVLKSGLIVDLAKNTVLQQKDGSEIPIDDSAAPIKDQNGNITGVILVFRDRTERKKDEEKLRESSHRIELMVEKLRVVGGLTRHDVRNKLSTVTGYAYLLKKKHGDQADIVEGLGKMEQAVKETVRIFEFAKMYEQIGAEELTPIDVEAKLNEAATLFSGSLPKIINGCHGLTLLADSFLRQLFYNFIDNTNKYGKKTTTIKVTYEKTNQDSLKLIYEDDGVGIPLENKQSLFKEGFSTGGSTGFGLFLTKKMVDVYGWEIEENGEPGIGAKFTITIPKLNKNGKENYRITQ